MTELLSKVLLTLIVLVIGGPIIAWAFGVEFDFKEVIIKVGPWILVAMLVTLIAIIWKKQ